MRYTALIIICLCLFVGASTTTAKAIADSTAFQGSLTDASNNPVSDGPRDLTISVWTDSVGGTMLYTEIRTVTTSKGLFTTCIGCGNSTFPDIFDGQTLFLQTQIPGQAPMSPRTRLRGVPYSISASSVNSEATNGAARARGIISTKPSVSSPKGRMLLDIDVDGNGVAEKSATTDVTSDSATSALTADTDGDGVPELSDRRTVSANEFHHNTVARTGSTTATIRQMATPDSVVSVLDRDSDGDGVPESSDRRTVSANEVHHNTVARTGSTTATIRQMATPDSASTTVDHDSDGDGVPESSLHSVAQSAGAMVRAVSEFNLLNTESRMYSSPESASVHCDADPDGNGTPNVSFSAVADDKYAQVRGFKVEIAGGRRSSFVSQCDSSGAISSCDADSDGDGHLEAAAVSSVTKLGGGGGGASSASYAATGRLYVDNNSDGTPDNEIESIVTPTTSSVAINTKGTGADKNRVISTTSTDGASLQASAAGKNIGLYISAVSGQSAFVMTDSSGGVLDTTVYIDGKNAKVGIGVSQPTARLQVVGGAYCDGTNWVNASDRNVKENFEPVDGEVLLDKIADLPITKWNYKGDTKTEHIGPTAQDFRETFGVGSDGKSISTIDPSGIALAGIKELSKQNRELQQQNRDLQKQNAELKKQMDELARKVERLAAGR